MHTRKTEIETAGMTASAVGTHMEQWIGRRIHHGCIAHAAAVAKVQLVQSSTITKVKCLTEEVAALRAQLAAAHAGKQTKKSS